MRPDFVKQIFRNSHGAKFKNWRLHKNRLQTKEELADRSDLDISSQAEKYLGERGNPEDPVFTGFTYGAWTSLELQRWSMAANINKNLTFHCGRHTFAVLMLDLGADIYTVSKLLGHKELATTQIYAKVLDKNKQNAVSLIPDID